MSQGEERHDYSRGREPRRSARARCACSARCSRPLRGAARGSTAVVVVVSHGRAGRRAGAHRVRHRHGAARAHRSGDWMPVGLAGLAYLLTGLVRRVPHRAGTSVLSARISQAVLLDLRTRIFLHTQKLSPRVPRVVHVGPHHLAADERPRRDPRAARRGHQRARARACSTWRSRAIALVLARPRSPGSCSLVALVPLGAPDALVPGALAGRCSGDSRRGVARSSSCSSSRR